MRAGNERKRTSWRAGVGWKARRETVKRVIGRRACEKWEDEERPVNEETVEMGRWVTVETLAARGCRPASSRRGETRAGSRELRRSWSFGQVRARSIARGTRKAGAARWGRPGDGG